MRLVTAARVRFARRVSALVLLAHAAVRLARTLERLRSEPIEIVEIERPGPLALPLLADRLGTTLSTESVLERPVTRPPKSGASGSNKARSRPKPAAAAAALESTKGTAAGRTSGTARESKALKTRLASLERGGGAGMPRRMGNRHNASLRRTVPRR